MARIRKSRRISRRGRPSRARRTLRRRTRRTTLARAAAIRPVNFGYLFPDRARMKMPYFSGPIAISGGVLEERVFCGNSLYDPDTTGTGHQPMNYDEMMLLYNRYYVAGSKIKVTVFVSGSGAYTNAGDMALVANVLSTPLNTNHTRNEISEQKGTKIRTFGGTGSTGPQSIQSWTSTKRMLSAPGRTSYDAQATSGANPADAWYWHFLMFAADNSSTLAGYYTIKVTYYAEFSERLATAGS